MARDYEKAPGYKAHEYLPLVFDVVQFKQTFSRDGHEELMKKLEEKLADLEAELDKDKMRSSAADGSLVQRFSDWMRPVFGCLPFGIGDQLAGCDPAIEQMHHSPNGDVTQSEAFSRTSQRSIISHHDRIGERTYQVASVERTSLVSKEHFDSLRLGSLSIFSPRFQLWRAMFGFLPARQKNF